MAATAFVRLAQSIAGISRPLLRSSIRRPNVSRKFHSVFTVSDVRKPVLQRRIECSAVTSDLGGSALYTTAAAAAEQATDDVAVVTPLCERPATYVTCLEELLQWRRKAELLAASVGKEFYEADGGPDASDLLRELEWLLDDAVAACCRPGRIADSSSGRCWQACSWRDVKACLPVETSPIQDADGESSSNESGEFGVFGTLLKERYTDPVAETAADGANSCDSLRDSLASMASVDEELDDTSEEAASTTTKFPTLEDEAIENKSTNAHLLLRSSIEELEEQWTQRVRNRRPFQYVVGCAHWRDLVLSVQEGVLIPRPETEQMIDLAEAAIAAESSLRDGVWADLGTGSGALAIALARLLSSSTGFVIAIDASPIAVAVARRNANQYGLTDRVKVVHGSWFAPLENYNGSLAGVLSNPPYIPSENIAGLQAEVGKHEPQSALDGGEDGMNDLRTICHGSSRALRSGGFLALETNGGKQAEAVSDLLHSLRTVGGFQTNTPVPCFQDIRIIPDFAGVMRFVVATRC